MFTIENKPFRSLPNKKIFISSAKSFGVAEVNAFWMSFTYSKKRRGPRTEPLLNMKKRNFQVSINGKYVVFLCSVNELLKIYRGEVEH